MKLSIVIPLFNEEENVRLLYNELKAVLENIKDRYDYEIIFVDDGSKDNTLKIINELARKDSTVKVISLNNNYGQSTALKAGFDFASGDVVITMDGDLQNDPQDILLLLKYIEDGYDVVSGRREKRKDSLYKRLSSCIANCVRRRFIKDNLSDIGCTLKAYRAFFLKKIIYFNGFHRFLPILLEWQGAKVIEVPVKHRPRKFGKSKYGILNRSIKAFLDMVCIWWLKKNRIDYQLKITGVDNTRSNVIKY